MSGSIVAGRGWQVTCMACPATFKTLEESFSRALAEAEALGWDLDWGSARGQALLHPDAKAVCPDWHSDKALRRGGLFRKRSDLL